MLRFIRSHITNTTESKAEDLGDYFSYSKITTHGFPQKSACIAIDEQLGLLAIGTKEGRIRIVGGEGIEWSALVEFGLPVAHIYFAVNSGMLIALCEDTRNAMPSFHRVQIVNDGVSVTRIVANGLPRHITCCEMLNREDGNSALLIGTESGNIFALWTQYSELVEYLIFQDSSLKRLPELFVDTSRRIDKILVYPSQQFFAGRLFLLFDSRVVVLYNTLKDECERVFTLLPSITDIFCDWLGTKLFCGQSDGSYTVFTINESGNESRLRSSSTLSLASKHIQLFGGQTKCTSMKQIGVTKLEENGTDLMAFTGGVPVDLYSDRYTLSLHLYDEFLALDFESPIFDFVLLNNSDGFGSALFVLCEQELVAIDLRDTHFRPFALPHFNPLHASPVTSTAIASHLSPNAFTRLCTIADRMDTDRRARHVSARPWPLRCGSGFSTSPRDCVSDLNPYDVTLLITGHENGCINIWLTNLLSLRPWISCATALEFDDFFTDTVEASIRDLVAPRRCDMLNASDLPLRRAGLFDSFCDDPRLSIVKLDFNPESAHLVAGGHSGHVLVFDTDVTDFESVISPVQAICVDMAEAGAYTDNTNGLCATQLYASCSTSRLYARGRETSLRPRATTRRRDANYGYAPAFNRILQFIPVAQISAVAYCVSRAILAAGNEFGYAICALQSGEILTRCCLLSSQEVLQISAQDGTLSRFKSVKKSIRQSFRRKRRQINCSGETSADTTDDRTLNLLEDYRTNEREISQRVTNSSGLGGETPHSLVKALYICQCRLGEDTLLADYLFVGTFGGAILVHHLLDASTFPSSYAKLTSLSDSTYGKSSIIDSDREQFALLQTHRVSDRWDGKCPLIKEIRLRHRAPIVSIECVQDLLSSRLMVFTEEQIRAFSLPALRPSRYKCRFTAVEGSRIRKAGTILMRNAKSKRIKSLERFIGLITNRGEVYALSLQNPRRMMHVPFTTASDAAGIASAVLSTDGELFYIRPGGSELQRASIAASPNYSAPTPFRDEQFRAAIALV